MARRPLIRDRQLALFGGIGLIFAGSFLLWDAYEGRGISRPFATKLLPGG